MASQGPITNTLVAATNLATVGTYDWTILDPNPGVDGIFGVTPIGSAIPDQEGPVKLLIGGAATGTDQSTATFFSGGPQTIAYGSAANTWGASPTAAQVNATGFGIAIAVKENFSGVVSHYLAVPFPGFTIPAGATINGIQFSIDYFFSSANNVVQVDSTSSCTVTYTPAAVPTNSVAPSCSPSSGTAGITAFSCTTGTWTNSPTSYSYQWKLNGSNVGTNSNTYTPVASGALTCTVTASNAGGPGTPAVSNSVTVNAATTGGDLLLLGVG